MPAVYLSPPMVGSRGADGSRLPEQVATPPSVTNLDQSICLSLVQFKGACTLTDLLRQYRALDDQVTLRFNRASARSRDTGASTLPSLLQKHTTQFNSASAHDLGKSTYGNMPHDVCAQFWQQLVNVWAGREDAIRYCIAVTDAKRLPTIADNPDLRLDGDARPAPAVQSRSEQMDEFTVRHLLTVASAAQRTRS